jgi:mono/diheme cytochrome c family protein
MPPIAGMTRARAATLLDLITAESALPESEFAGLDIGDEPFSALDIERGRQLFEGRTGLANGGPPCLSCHTSGSLGGLGGGRLGPDLTRVYERLQGRKALASWLLAPATQMMRPVYANSRLKNEEILPLVAFLEDEARRGTEGRGSEDPGTIQITFLLLGLAGAALGFVAADGIWRGRFRDVRKPLVRGKA